MYSLLYNLFLAAYHTGIYGASFFKGKAKKWISGRKHWHEKMLAVMGPGEKRIWVHCASLGEFEQARPFIESLKEKYPAYKILLSFFSPSGYEIRKDYGYADYVCYLPLDGRQNAMHFVALVNPSLVVFVKYEFWHYYLIELKKHKIPTILISAAFRRDQVFFKWYGKFFRNLLYCFDWIFLQDEASQLLLQGIGIDKNSTIAGDTRYDRVLTIAANQKKLPLIESFINQGPVLIAGSTWPGDEKILQAGFKTLPASWKLIIAPHEIGADRLAEIKALFPMAVLYSELTIQPGIGQAKVLIMDNIGMLSHIYAYGEIAFVGGGFQKGGIHNILEPAVFGLPVIFGPVYKKFVEANELVSLQYAFPIRNPTEYNTLLQSLIIADAKRMELHQSLKKHMQQKAGATQAILNRLEAEKWIC